MCAAKYMQILTKYIEACGKSKNFMKFAGVMRPIAASEGRVKVEFEVTPELTNPWGGLHGGCTATFIDMVTTAACLTMPRELPGVSVDLHVTYLAAAKEGDSLIMDAEVIKAGKTLAFTRADLLLKENNRVLAIGLHTKAFPASK